MRALDPGARAELVSQTDTQAVVKVSKTDFFGPLVKNYVFDIVPGHVAGVAAREPAGR